MDEIVARGMAKWPNVPDVFGWLMLDRRGNWLLRSAGADSAFARIGNQALREFIARNYAPDGRGRWFFQNGPQRVFVTLAYTPWVVRLEGEGLMDHCGHPFEPLEVMVDEEGSLLMAGKQGLALLDDRDLAAFSDRAEGLPRVRAGDLPRRFQYVPNPAP